jgi:hypothetical protein
MNIEKSPLELFTEAIDSGEFEKWFSQKIKIENHQITKVESFIDSLPEDQLDEWITKLINWERKFEELQYRVNHCDTSSNIFHLLTKALSKRSNPINDLDENFLADAFEWRGYIFKLYVGQGAFWAIEKDLERIF